MKKILTLMTMLVLSAALFAGIPHPVFVDYTGSPESFEAYLDSDISSMLYENSVGCGILSSYDLIMVECGNFPIWHNEDVLYIVKTEGENVHYCSITLSYDNVQYQEDPVWTLGYPPTGGTVSPANVFAEGWNLWSHNVVIEDNAVENVFSPLGDNLTKVKSITQSYDPSLDPNFNTLESIVDGYGYWVQVTELDTLEFVDAVALDKDNVLIDLDTGWNLIGYIPQEADNVTHAYAGIAVLEKVKSITQSYDPGLDPQFNTLEIVAPGYGYWIKVAEDVEDFTYPEPLELERSMKSAVYAWTPVIYTNSTCAYAMINESFGQIGAFAGEECRAVTEINNGYVSLVINGEEAETIRFKLYQNGQVTDLSTQITTAPGEDIFFELTSDAPEITTTMSIYPNPFNPQTTIAYNLAATGKVIVDVYNVKGQKVVELVNDTKEAGQHNVVWNAAGQASGIYFVKMNTGKTNQVQKVILMK